MTTDTAATLLRDLDYEKTDLPLLGFPDACVLDRELVDRIRAFLAALPDEAIASLHRCAALGMERAAKICDDMPAKPRDSWECANAIRAAIAQIGEKCDDGRSHQ
jgi:hypothetical protein